MSTSAVVPELEEQIPDVEEEQEPAFDAEWGGGLVALTQRWFRNFTNKAAGITALTGYKSLSNLVTMLDYSGVPTTSFSYNAAANSIYASTTNKLY